MFFIGVFGIEDKQSEIKTFNNLECKVCNESTKGKLIKKYSYFHFFFIPLFKWNESYYIVCDRCSSVYSISKEKGKSLESNEDVNISYWDLKEVYSGNSNEGDFGNNICRSCNAEVDKSFKYCPHCGQRMR